MLMTVHCLCGIPYWYTCPVNDLAFFGTELFQENVISKL